MDSLEHSFYFYCLDLIYNEKKEEIGQMVCQEMLDTLVHPKALWQDLMTRPMHGGILLSFYYWLQNTSLSQQDKKDCLEWLIMEQWDKLPCLTQLVHIYYAWKTKTSSFR